MDRDEQTRAAAFQRVGALSGKFAGAIPWSELGAGFVVAGEQILFSGRAHGIFRPRQIRRGVLSIKTTVPRQGRQRKYEDIASDQGFFLYRFQGEDANNADNRALRESWEDQSPLIYFMALLLWFTRPFGQHSWEQRAIVLVSKPTSDSPDINAGFKASCPE
jgi:putative restriction endonuclease